MEAPFRVVWERRASKWAELSAIFMSSALFCRNQGKTLCRGLEKKFFLSAKFKMLDYVL